MPTIADVTTQALSFPSKSRAILADLLLDSLNEVESTNYDKLWLIEAKRRDKEITDNNVSCKTNSEVLKRAKKELQCR